MRLEAVLVRRFVATALLAAATAAAPVHAGATVTSLLLQSDPGDFIGAGQTLSFTAADGTFSAQQNFGGGVSVSFETPTFSHFWFLDFAPISGQPLTVGLYTGATRFPFQAPTEPGLSVDGDGRGCNTLTGSFEVKEIAFGAAGDVTAFRATFEQHCEGAVPALRGEVRFNATVPIELAAPPAVSVVEGQALSFAVSATDLQGLPVTLTATGLPAGATFVDHGDATGTFSWTPAVGQAGSYAVQFSAADGQSVETSFTRITVTRPPPVNDDIRNAVLVPGLPFTFSEDTTAATAGPDDPFGCFGTSASVWFAFTPQANVFVEANTFGSGYDTTLSVFTGSPGGLGLLSCNDNAGGGLQSRVRFNAQAGVTYWFMVSGFGFFGGGGQLVLNVLQGPPPLKIALLLDASGSAVPSTGAVTVTGTLVCNRPVFGFVSGQISQPHAGAVLSGFFFTSLSCDGRTAWNAPVSLAPSGLFHGRAAALFVGGKANVSASAFAFDPDSLESAQSTAAATVTLRGGK